MKEATTRNRFIIVTIMIALIAGLFIPGNVYAKSKLKRISSNKVYKSFDLNNDGKKDKLKIKTVKTYAKNYETKKKVFINNKKRFNVYGCKDAEVYVFRKGKRSILLSVFRYGDGGSSTYAYVYKNGKFRKKDLSAKGTFYNDPTVSKNNLLIESQPKGGWWTKSFENCSIMPFKSIQPYKLKNGKLKKAKKYPYVVPNDLCYDDEPAVEFIAGADFKTGQTVSSVGQKDGPEVFEGDNVKFTSMIYRKGNYYYRINVNGNSGWFKDSSSIYFYWK